MPPALPRKILTERSVAALKASNVRQEIADGAMPGLYIIVQPQPSGRKSWAVRFRKNKRPKKVTIGRADAIGLADAREEARKIIRRNSLGHDDDIKFSEAVALYVKRRGIRTSTAHYHKRELTALSKLWPKRKLSDIPRRELIELLEETFDKRGPGAANTLKKVLSKFFRWCAGRDLIAQSPMSGVEKPQKEVPRERVLTDDELGIVWRAADPCVRLIILTAGRRNEISDLKWSEISDDAITLPADRVKQGRKHVIYLTPEMRAVLATLKRRGPYVFRGDRPLHAVKPKVSIPHFTLHDLRRTAATGMSRLKVAPHIVDACLGHKLKGIVSQTYNLDDFEADCRKAWTLWSERVAAITQPGTAAQSS